MILMVVGLFFVTLSPRAHGADPFKADIRSTEPLRPEDEQKSFHLPPGFEIQLFAAEPDLQKPFNMAFDAKGRLWVSGSTEYPYPAPLDKPGRDTIKILEDTNGDGRADKITTFADELNIPIGLYPYRNGVIAFSIPNIYFLEDVDGDGHADQRHTLYGPLDYKHDTHGMNNGFRRGFDGWIYACHGWENRDTITARDGSTISMHGGATFRFRPDAARIELFTRGQVNPFGMTIDARGDIFDADCHTRPITLLLRGGCYENFGKQPRDGLGFVPPVMEHNHGSTAIAGTTVYEADRFPPEYSGNMFAGNVMTSRVNRDSLRFHGSTVIAHEEPDFVTSDDPWFRPVDLQVGPDGALYIADFYNRIIGHYEVPLEHPGRDRHRGRIWRVTYVGPDKNTAQHAANSDLSKATAEELIAVLRSPNLTLRFRATDELSDRCGDSAVELLRKTARESSSATARAHSLWVLFRLGRIHSVELLKAAKDSDPLVRTHAMRMIAETPQWSSQIGPAGLAALGDSDGFVRRAAVDALGQHPEFEAVNQLLELLSNAPKDDVHLRHMARIALRHQLRPEGRLTRLDCDDASRLSEVAGIAIGLDSPEAAAFLANYLTRLPVGDEKLFGYVSHAARYVLEENLESLISAAQEGSADDVDLLLDLFSAIDRGLQQRGLTMPTALSLWGTKLVPQLLAAAETEEASWQADPSGPKGQKAWGLEERTSVDGQGEERFLSSLPFGERYTGTLRSKPFAIPPKLEFFVCGHLGPPNERPVSKNQVRLILAATNEVIAECLAPCNDVAQKFAWNLQAYAGQEGYLEIVDGVKAATYAWIGAGRFNPPMVRVPSISTDALTTRGQSAARLIARLKLVEMSGKLKEMMLDESIDLETQAAAAQSLVALRPHPESAALAEHVTDESVSAPLRSRMLEAVASDSENRVKQTLAELMRAAPERLQKNLALKLAEHHSGAETLIAMLEKGTGAASLLRDETIVEKLRLAAPQTLSQRIEALTANLPPQNEEIQLLIAKKRQQFSSANPSITRGEKVFAQHCSACHQFRGQGTIVGPQLDGIGNRGEERVIEDILDPNRNVDAAFHTSVYLLDDGRVLSGLFRRTEGRMTVIADPAGKEISFPTSDIEVEKKTKSSLMPNNLGTTLTEQDFNDLAAVLLADHQPKPASIDWTVVEVDRRFRSEGVAVADINRDGKADIIVGELWYEAPEWRPHEIYPVGQYGDGVDSYSSCFLCFADDVNRDGWADVIVIGFPGQPCHWYENPQGKNVHWNKHLIWSSACNETPLFVDLFGKGQKVLVMAWQPDGKTNQGQMAWFTPDTDPTQPWKMHPISDASSAGNEIPGTQRYSHGLGAGDLNGDGRIDVLCTSGWWEQPATLGNPWPFHPANLGEPCANMCVVDTSGDGLADVISSSAHAYGIWSYTQQGTAKPDPVFKKRDLFPQLLSQTHSLACQDLDGDGLADLVTGKRWWAHGPKGDPGSDEPAVLYWFRSERNSDGGLSFTPYLIHSESGVGTQFELADVNGDGKCDIVTSNKKGVHLFLQRNQFP